MNKVCFCFKMPHNSYVGGIATILNNYMAGYDLFEEHEYDTVLFDYQNKWINKVPSAFLRNIIYGIAQERALKKFVKKENIDILHIHTSRKLLFMKDVIVGKNISRATKKKVILTVHVGDGNTVFSQIPLFLKKLAIKWLNKYFAKVVFLSKEIEKQFIDWGLSSQKAKVLYNFFDIKKAEDSFEQGTLNDKLNLLFVASINKEKGILELLRAIKEIDDDSVFLDICGQVNDKAIKEEFENYVNELSSNVKLHGYVTGEKKEEIYKQADALVLPSYREGLPLVILEALASNCGIISTPVGATPEILDNSNALWVEKQDVESLKNAICRLKNDRQLLDNMKRNNLLKSEIFSKKSHIANLCEIYDSVLLDNRPKVLLTFRIGCENSGPYTSHTRIMQSRLCEKYNFEPLMLPNPRKLRRPNMFFKTVRYIKKAKPAFVHLTGLQMEGFLVMLACRIAGVKTVVAARGSSTEAIGFGRFAQFIFRTIEKFTVKNATAVYGVSNYVSSWDVFKKAKFYYGTIYNMVKSGCIEREKLHIRESLGIHKDDIVITSTGRINKDKGFDTLCETVKQLKDIPNIKFIIAGTGNYKDQWFEEVKQAGMENRVFFLGYTNNVDVLLEESDIFIICTKHETLCNALLEAAAHSLPMVASNVGGIPEIIDDGKNGFLVPVGNVEEFKNAIITLINDFELRVNMGKEAKNKIDSNFSENAITAKLDELYNYVLGAKR